jgi:rhamnosyltransferase subunit B
MIGRLLDDTAYAATAERIGRQVASEHGADAAAAAIAEALGPARTDAAPVSPRVVA